jgi:hypothetical protein
MLRIRDTQQKPTLITGSGTNGGYVLVPFREGSQRFTAAFKAIRTGVGREIQQGATSEKAGGLASYPK